MNCILLMSSIFRWLCWCLTYVFFTCLQVHWIYRWLSEGHWCSDEGHRNLQLWDQHETRLRQRHRLHHRTGWVRPFHPDVMKYRFTLNYSEAHSRVAPQMFLVLLTLWSCLKRRTVASPSPGSQALKTTVPYLVIWITDLFRIAPFLLCFIVFI